MSRGRHHTDSTARELCAELALGFGLGAVLSGGAACVAASTHGTVSRVAWAVCGLIALGFTLAAVHTAVADRERGPR